MKRSIVILTVLLTACAPVRERMVQAQYTEDVQDYRIYSENGDYAGRIDETNRIYDRDGNFIGMIRP